MDPFDPPGPYQNPPPPPAGGLWPTVSGLHMATFGQASCSNCLTSVRPSLRFGGHCPQQPLALCNPPFWMVPSTEEGSGGATDLTVFGAQGSPLSPRLYF